MPQCLPQRCFLLGYAGEVVVQPCPGSHWRITGTLDVTYLAPQRGQALAVKQELNSVFMQLSLQLTCVRHNDLEIHLQRHRRTEDGADQTLHDLVRFEAVLIREDIIPLMRDIKINKEEIKA